ncbi:hypothetical protein ACFXAF_00470 [Kitasatospora sp. NPDC059463]|uniref:hypothetical protein n=1 Tax=unclassified Kitasatospora TaxID=2633591 RepID=UPI00368F8580
MADNNAAHTLTCPNCRSTNITLHVREWAVCDTCKYGDLWGRFMTCNCWGYDCITSEA